MTSASYFLLITCLRHAKLKKKSNSTSRPYNVTVEHNLTGGLYEREKTSEDSNRYFLKKYVHVLAVFSESALKISK